MHDFTKLILLLQLLLEVNLGMTQLLDFQTPNIHYQFLLMYEYNILVKVPSFHNILEILVNHMEHLELLYVENYNDQHKMLYTLLASLCTHLGG